MIDSKINLKTGNCIVVHIEISLDSIDIAKDFVERIKEIAPFGTVRTMRRQRNENRGRKNINMELIYDYLKDGKKYNIGKLWFLLKRNFSFTSYKTFQRYVKELYIKYNDFQMELVKGGKEGSTTIIWRDIK